MLVFIDDSGDPGFKLDSGSTPFFIIAMVIFDDELEVEKTAIAIKQLKRDLKFSEDTEFRFFKTKHEYRITFLDVINQFKFKIRCLVVDKSIINSPELRNKRDKFYSYFIKEALKHSSEDIKNAKIRIDGSGDRNFRKSFLGYLKREINNDQNKIMKNCKLINSKSSALIQMADMIAGSINRSYSDKKGGQEYKSIFKKHISSEWQFK